MPTRFPIRFDDWYGLLSTALFLPPSSSYVEVGDGQVVARMGWGFRTKFPISAVVRTSRLDDRPISRGVHGWAGRWLVNGSGEGIVAIEIHPAQRAWVMGFPVRLRQLMISVQDPEGLRAALR
jgi:hypothetical protein